MLENQKIAQRWTQAKMQKTMKFLAFIDFSLEMC